MTPFGLSGLLTGISSICFGSLVLRMSPNRAIGKTWFLFALSVGIWGFGGMWIGFSSSHAEGLLAWRLAYGLGVIWIAPLFYHFVCTFLELERKRSIVGNYLLGVFFLSFLPTSLFFEKTRYIFDSLYYALGGPVYLVYFIWWIGLVVYSHIELIRVHKSVSRTKQNQIKYFFLATAVGYTGGSLAYLPNFGIDIYPWGNFGIVLYPLIMFYAITRHQLMDVNLLIRKTITYSVVTGTLTAIYLVTITLIARVFDGFSEHQTFFSSGIAAALMGLCFNPFRDKVQTIIDRKFFRQYVDREEKLYEISRDVVTHTTPEAMGEALIRVMGEALHPKSSVLFLKSRDGTGFVPVSHFGESGVIDRLSDDGPLASYFRDHPQPFIFDEKKEIGTSRDTRRGEKNDRRLSA